MQAQTLAVLCIPPSAILDGMYMSGLYNGGLLDASFAVVVLCMAMSVAQSAVFVFIWVEAKEARRLMREAFSLKPGVEKSALSDF